jgi:hypothetical protein
VTDVVVLVDPPGVAAEVSGELLRSRVDASSRVLQAPDQLLGAGIVTDPGAPVWWESQQVAADPVVVCRFHDLVARQLESGLAATWVVWCAGVEEQVACEERGQIGVIAEGSEELADWVVSRVLAPRGGFRLRERRAEWGPFARRGAGPEAPPAPATPCSAAPPVTPPPPLSTSAPASADAEVGPPPAVIGRARATSPPTDEGGGEDSGTARRMRWPDLCSVAQASQPAWSPALLSVPPLGRPGEQLGSAQLSTASVPPPLSALSRGALTRGPRGTDGVGPEAHPGAAGGPGRAGPPHLAALEERSSSGVISWVRSAVRREAALGDRLGTIGGRLERRHSTTLGMVSSKGGVGKTTTTAGVGLVAEMALAGRGAAVALVEGNPDNADLAIELAVPREAPTVRELIAALEGGQQAPRPHTVAGTRLEVWPEARQSAGHGQGQIARLGQHLRATCTVMVVDFNNCLPDRGGGPAPELLHGWSEKALVAAAESIDALVDCVRATSGGRTPGFVAPLLINDPGARRDRKHRGLIQEFQRRGVAVVEVPWAPQLGRAALDGRRITDVHRGVTRAWVDVLAEAVTAAEEVIG